MSGPLPAPDYSKIVVGGFRNHPLGRALGMHRLTGAQLAAAPLRVLDACGGYGEDGYLMAAWGCDVTSCERDAETHTMLASAVGLVVDSGTLKGCWSVIHADARGLLSSVPMARPGAEGWTEANQEASADVPAEADVPDGVDPADASRANGPGVMTFDVVYIDPMFPTPPGGRRAAEGKAMRRLRERVGDDADAGELLAAALDAARRVAGLRRVIVKRPLRAPRLGGVEPEVVQRGKSVRYDVYVRP